MANETPRNADTDAVRKASIDLLAKLRPALNEWITESDLEPADALGAVTRAVAILCVETSISQKKDRETGWRIATRMAEGVRSLVHDYYKNRHAIDPTLPPLN